MMTSWPSKITLELRAEEANDERPSTNDEVSRWEPLGNHQLATALLLERHGVLQRDNGALRFLIRWRLGGNSLQPQAGRSHEGKQGSAMLRREADDLIRNPGNDGQQGDPRSEARPEC